MLPNTSNSTLDKQSQTKHFIPNVLSLLSSEPHPDDIELNVKLRECKTPVEAIKCLEENGFTSGGQNITSNNVD